MSPFYLILFTMVAGDIAWWIFAHRRLPRRWMRIVAGLFAFLQLSGLALIIVGRRATFPLEDYLPRYWQSAILVWHLLILLPWLIVQLGRGVAAGGRWWKHQRGAVRSATTSALPAAAEAEAGEAISRRQFLGAAAVFTPPLLTFGAAAVGEMQLDSFRVRRMQVNLPDLPPALDGFTIAHVTDVHVGRFTRGRVLERIVTATNGLDADIIAITGDLINDSLRAMPAAMDLVRGFRAKRMVVACEGNHDLIDNPREFYRLAEKGGMPLLRGESASIDVNGQKVQVLGMPWSRREELTEQDAKALLARKESAAWQLMLVHHPHAWDVLPEVPLTLAGHTHGGQLMMSEESGFGPLIYRYWSGIYRRKPNEALVVSNGTGNWFPVRVHAPAEVIHLTLRRQAV